MQLNRIGNIEQESDLPDLDQIEREMESELEDDAVDVQPEPSASPATAATKPVAQSPAQQNMFMIANGRGGKGASKFMPQVQVRSNFWPGQPFTMAKQDASEQKRDLFFNTVKPVSLLDSKFDPRLRQKPANDSKQPKADADAVRVEPSTSKSTRSRFARATVEALLSIGALPMAMLVEIGRFRQAKENRFFSSARLERALGQGNDDAERFAAANPNMVKKKDLAPPAPTGPK
jgi:hypothetical protein